jgi:DNA-nicking Smr family endonuclease
MAWSPPEVGEPLKFLRPGHSPELVRKLRRGQWRVEDELDLHGLNRIQAEQALGGFLDQMKACRRRCVRIVHGKGLGVLRETLRAVLPARPEVLGFVEAPAAQGGSGAVLVLLKP